MRRTEQAQGLRLMKFVEVYARTTARLLSQAEAAEVLGVTEGGDGIWSSPKPAPAGAPRDFQSLYEQQRTRAEAAEARCEELRWAEVAARSDVSSWKSRFRSCRRRLSEAVEEVKDLRRAARAAPSLPAAVVRLETLLSEAGIASDETGALEALSKEVVRLREALAEPEGVEGIVRWHSGEARRDRASLRRAAEPSVEGL